MSQNTIKNIIKYCSIAFIVLSVAMLFFGGVGINDASAREIIRAGIDSSMEKLDMSEEEIDRTEAGMAMLGVDIDIRDLIGRAKKVANVARDGRLSARELAFTATTAAGLISELKDNPILSFLSDKDLDELMTKLDSAGISLYAVAALFWITLICAVLVIILHMLNMRLPGVSVVVLSLVWLLAFIVMKIKLNDTIVNELDGPEGVLSITAAPVIGFVAAVLAMTLWLLRDMLAERLGNDDTSFEAVPAPSYARAGVNEEIMSDEVAGTVSPLTEAWAGVREGEAIVTTVEIPVTAPEIPVAASETPVTFPETPATFPAASYRPKPEDFRFCPKCGAEVDPDYDFCSSCGSRIFSR